MPISQQRLTAPDAGGGSDLRPYAPRRAPRRPIQADQASKPAASISASNGPRRWRPRFVATRRSWSFLAGRYRTPPESRRGLGHALPTLLRKPACTLLPTRWHPGAAGISRTGSARRPAGHTRLRHPHLRPRGRCTCPPRSHRVTNATRRVSYSGDSGGICDAIRQLPGTPCPALRLARLLRLVPCTCEVARRPEGPEASATRGT